MTLYRLKNLKRYQKGGTFYSYHRPSGTRIEPPHEFGTAAFLEAFRKAENRHQAASRTTTRTLGSLIASYKASPDFVILRDRTRSDYAKVLSFLANLDAMPIDKVDSAFVAQLRDKAFRLKKRRFANYILSVLSAVFRHGVEFGLVKANPVVGTRQIRKRSDAPIANRAWTEDEKAVVLAHAPPQLLPLIATARWTGMRQGDVVKMAKTAYSDGHLRRQTSKRGLPVDWEVPHKLRIILDGLPAHQALTLFVTSRGKPWSSNGFRTSFFKLIRRLEGDKLVGHGLTFHGLRTSFVEEARRNGHTLEDIADALGQSSSRSAGHYARNTDRQSATKRISDSLNGTEPDQKLSTKLSTAT